MTQNSGNLFNRSKGSRKGGNQYANKQAGNWIILSEIKSINWIDFLLEITNSSVLLLHGRTEKLINPAYWMILLLGAFINSKTKYKHFAVTWSWLKQTWGYMNSHHVTWSLTLHDLGNTWLTAACLQLESLIITHIFHVNVINSGRVQRIREVEIMEERQRFYKEPILEGRLEPELLQHLCVSERKAFGFTSVQMTTLTP